MTFKTLAAHLDVGQTNSEVLRIAAELGARFEARIVGIAACQPMQFAAVDGYVVGDVMAACQDELQAELRNAETEFRAALKDSRCPLDWRSSYTTEALPYYVASEARCADLIVTSSVPPDVLDSSRHTSLGDLVLRAGRPLLVVPRTGARMPFARALIAWQDTREARRAAADALPLLALAQQVTVLEIAAADEMPSALGRAQDVVHWLERHGIPALPQALVAAGDTAAQLGAVLETQDIDLVIAGAYGHGRLREWAFGGVTRALLKGGRCALLSH